MLLVERDKTAGRRAIEVAYDDGTTAVVSKGLAAGDQVIVSGQGRVSTGSRLALHDTKDGGNTTGGEAQQSAQK